jgi:hypothetical protein
MKSAGVLLVIIGFLMLSLSCAKNKKLSTPFSEQNLSKVISDLNNNFSKNKNTLVMVSSSPHTPTGQDLRDRRDLLAEFKTGGYYDHLIFNLASLQDRDELARIVHNDNGACGGLEVIDPEFRLDVDLDTAISALWSPLVALNEVETLIQRVSAENILAQIKVLEAIPNRFHSGAHKDTAVATVKSMWTDRMPASGQIAEVDGGSTTSQYSVVLSLPGQEDDDTTVVIGAHLDSINRSGDSAPGADDDASGIASLAEILRVIKSTGVTFKRRVEFHAYAAEEVGLVGSGSIAKEYRNAGRKIAGMLQLDMNSYAEPEYAGKIFLVTTHTSPILRRQLADLSARYGLGIPEEMALTAGTSDHKAWTNQGFHSVFPFEHPTAYNKRIHTSSDSSTHIDSSLSEKFSRLALTWIAHEAGLQTTSTTSEHNLEVQTLKESGQSTKVAIVSGQSTGWRMIAATKNNVTSVVSCLLSTPDDHSCISNIRKYDAAGSRGAKLFYVDSSDTTLSSGEIHRIVSYDSSGVAVGMRTVQLSQK